MKRRTSNRNRKKSLKARKNEEQEEDARAEFSLKRPKRKADEPLSATESVAHTAKKSRPPLSAPKTPTAAKAPAGIATPVAGAEVPNNHKGFRDPFQTAASELPETQVNQASKQGKVPHTEFTSRINRSSSSFPTCPCLQTSPATCLPRSACFRSAPVSISV